MGEAEFDDAVAFLSQPMRAAAVLCRTEHGNLHAGVLHRRENGTAAVLHLGWLDYLSLDWKWERLWAAPSVEPERLISVGGICRRVWELYETTRTFPYGLRFSQTSFSAEGQLQLGPGARGLTCATFILAVFNSMGVRLVDEADWPIRQEEDRRFLDSIRGFATSAHFERLSEEVEAGVARIHPQEVLGACSCEPPASFPPSAAAGRLVLNLLDGRHGKASQPPTDG